MQQTLEQQPADLWPYAFWDGLEPDPEYSIREWADEHRMLSSKATAEVGQWRTARTPYLAEIMESLSPSCRHVRFVTFWAGAQLGKTETGNNLVGHTIDVAPGPMLIVWPDLDMARKNSRMRVDPLVDACPSLRAKVAERKRASAANTVLLKDFPGGVLSMTGANSSSGLKSMPVRVLFLDELDDFPPELPGQGDPEELAITRTRTFRNTRKVYRSSTCTVEGRSRIADAYQNGDQRVYEVPCPDCGVFQVFRWSRMRWEKDGKGKAIPESIRYHCKGCGVAIANHQKTGMLAAGRWRVENPDADGTHRSYWLSALYSPVGWYAWEDALRDFQKAVDSGKPAKLQEWTNTVLAETWKDRGEAPDWKMLFRRREAYKVGTVPRGAVFLTAGVDVQNDRLEMEVVAWGKGKESWSVDYVVLPGDPAQEAVWSALDQRLAYHYPHAKKANLALPIARVAIDAGHLGSTVYTFCRTREQCMAVRGRETLMLVVGQPTYVDVNHDGRRIARGGQLWPVGVNMVKSELYSWLRQEPRLKRTDPHPPGWCHFPRYPEEYFKQLTAEQIVRRKVRGYSRSEWEKIRDRNEALDCRVYARAAANVVGLDRLTPEQWDELEAALMGGGVSTGTPARHQQQRRDTEGWLD